MKQQELKELLSYNKITGNFVWRIKRNGTKGKAFAGSFNKSSGYILICVNQKRYLAHRLAWIYVYGTEPECDIDHIDGNKTNNSIANLRIATRSQNSQNIRKPRSDNRHGFMGCSFDPRDKRWSAKIMLNGKNYHLGRFATGEEAEAAYLEKKREIHTFSMI